MTALEIMKNWLRSFPLWDDRKLCVDYTDGIPEHCGLFCRGLEEVSRKEDVLGGVETVNRAHFVLHHLGNHPLDNAQHANWLLQLQTWIQQQSAKAEAPVFGDVPQRERIWAENGRLQDVRQTGTARHTAVITAEFIKLY